MKAMKEALALVVMLIALSLTVFTGSAAAGDPPTTPNGWQGACNMMQAVPGVRQHPGVGVQSGGGMDRAMSVDNDHGNAGMIAATERTSDTSTSEAGCP
jgi:hypothetical protein